MTAYLIKKKIGVLSMPRISHIFTYCIMNLKNQIKCIKKL